MAVRFLEDGFEYLDPMSGVNPLGSVVVYDDGQRTTMPWDDRPGYGKNESIASEAMRWMTVPREQLAATPPPVPQQLFPPRFGYSHEQVTIEDIFDPRLWGPQVRSWAAPQVRTPRRRFEEDEMWAGTERNMSTSVNPML